MIIALCILIVLVLVLGFCTVNLLKKNEKLEDAVVKYQNDIKDSKNEIELINKKINEIDEKGAFKSDDEVGFFFESLKRLRTQIWNLKINL